MPAKYLKKATFLGILAVGVGGTFCLTQAATFRVISNIGGYSQPGGLLEGSPGIFYSASEAPPCLFSSTKSGTLTNLGCPPGSTQLPSAPAAANNRRVYSATWTSGQPTGNVFSVTSAANSEVDYSQQTLVPSFSISLPDGTLAGYAVNEGPAGGTYLGKSDTQGNVTSIVQFPGTDLPSANVTYGSDGNFYGVAQVRIGSDSYIYQVTPAGAFTKLYDFGGNYFGSYTDAYPLVQASDGNFYGVTPAGGSTGGGTFYKLTMSGQYTLLYGGFPRHGATSKPHYLIQASDGNFYGATLGSGGDTAIFRLTASGQFTLIHKMAPADGQCNCTLIQGSDGIIYGIAIAGGPTGSGSFFAVNLGLPKPAPQALQFSPQSGAVGTNVMIWGYNLLSAKVSFNGAAAVKFYGSGPNYVWATVPAGATSGPITITTPGGSSTTTASFTVQ